MIKTLSLLALATATGLAATAAFAGETTVIEKHSETRIAPPPPPAVVTTRTVAVHHMVRTHTTPTSYRARRHVVHHHAVAMVKQSDGQAPPYAEQRGADSVSSIDRKTVIHRNDEGDVSKRTVVDKTYPDGSHTTIERHSTSDDRDAPPPSAPPPPAPVPPN